LEETNPFADPPEPLMRDTDGSGGFSDRG
jgi:hypothetical protein